MKRKIFNVKNAIVSLSVALLICAYACESGMYNDSLFEEPEELEVAVRSMRIDSKLDAIAESNEFIDFVAACEAFMQQMDAYKATLNPTEQEKLLHISDATQRMNILKEAKAEDLAKQIIEYGKYLHENSNYMGLRTQEKKKLFSSLSMYPKVKLLKTREENMTKEECKKEYDRKKEEAKQEFIENVAEDTSTLNQLIELWKRFWANHEANKEYEDCLENAKE